MMQTPWNEAEFWDNRFKVEDIPWDIGKVSPTLSSIESTEIIPAGGSIIVPGAGNGHDSIYFAKKGYIVSAVDWSKTAISSLRGASKANSVDIELLCASFWDIPSTWFGSFDGLVEHTFYCAIDPALRSRYVDMAANLLRPGGHLIGAVFIGDPGSDYLNRVEPPFFTTVDEFTKGFRAKFDIEILNPSNSAVDGRKEFEYSAVLKRKI